MTDTHLVRQSVDAITVWNGNSDKVEFGAYDPERYRVGFDGVTRIEACEKPGEYCMLPYFRVWKDETCFAEFGQHKIVGVYFSPAAIEAAIPATRDEPAGGWPPDHTGEPSCVCDECIPF